MIIKTERRTADRRLQTADPFAPERRQTDRRTMCWEVENCSLTIRYRCPAFILRRPCWELWSVEGVGPARACCHNEIDCEPGRCVIAEKRFAATAEPLTVHVGRRGDAESRPAQILLEQAPNAVVVVDDEQVARAMGVGGGVHIGPIML